MNPASPYSHLILTFTAICSPVHGLCSTIHAMEIASTSMMEDPSQAFLNQQHLAKIRAQCRCNHKRRRPKRTAQSWSGVSTTRAPEFRGTHPSGTSRLCQPGILPNEVRRPNDSAGLFQPGVLPIEVRRPDDSAGFCQPGVFPTGHRPHTVRLHDTGDCKLH